MAFERKLEYGFIWLNHSLLTSGKTWLIRLHAPLREFCANMDILSFTRFSEHNIIVMASEYRDFVFLKRLGSNLVPINLNFGDWVNPRVFRPLQGMEKHF